jgi:signal transduction histidine kinase
MKDVGQEVAHLVGGTHSKGAKMAAEPNFPLSPSATPCHPILATATPTPLMWNNENFAKQWQQILQTPPERDHNPDVLEQLIALVGRTFQADACLIVLPNSPAKCWFSKTSVVASVAPAAADPLLAQVPDWVDPIAVFNWGEHAAQSQSSSAQAQLLNTWRSVVTLIEPCPPVQAMLGMAVPVQGVPVGIISLMRSQFHSWSLPELEGLHMVSYQVGTVLSQLQMQEQIAKQMQYQAVVNQLTMAIRNSSDLNAILQQATQGTAQAIGADRAMLLRLKYWDPLFKNRIQEQSPKIRTVMVCEWPGYSSAEVTPIVSESAPDSTSPLPSSHTHSFWMSECTLCQQAFAHSSQPLVITSRQDLSTFNMSGNVAAVFNLEAMASLLMAPLESQGTILGFLVLQHAPSYVWQPEEIELVKLVSAQVSTAIIQAETLRQVQSLVEKRTAELQQSLSIQAKLYERTRQQLEQLRHLNQLKDEFLSTISHELRTPLTSMTMAIRMLRQVGVDSDRGDRYLDILEQQCAQETNLINDLLALQELESKQVSLQLEEIDLKAMVTDLAALVQPKWAAKGLTLDLDLPPTSLRLSSDRDSLNRILLELLTNAGKYSDPNSQVRLRVAYQPASFPSTIQVNLCNIGAGISAEELPFIFDKFRRCQGATDNAVQGTGLGLALVRSLVQLIGGTIVATSTPHQEAESYETCLTLSLPQTFDGSHL